MSAVEAERSSREERREELAATIARLQTDVGAFEARIAEVTRTMHSGAVTVPRELQALQHEQESLRRRQDHLETEELEIMEELDPLTEEVAGLDGRLEELAAEGERLAEALLQAEVDLEEELTAVTRPSGGCRRWRRRRAAGHLRGSPGRARRHRRGPAGRLGVRWLSPGPLGRRGRPHQEAAARRARPLRRVRPPARPLKARRRCSSGSPGWPGSWSGGCSAARPWTTASSSSVPAYPPSTC